MDIDDLVPMDEAVRLSGYARGHIGHLCREGKLPGARLFGGRWLIPRGALAGYVPAPPGPRPGSKREKKEDPLEAELKEVIERAKDRRR